MNKTASDNIPYAGFWVRFFAACIDLAIYTPPYMAIKAIAGEEYRWWAEGVFIVLGLLSYAWFFASKWQASPGMKLLGIRIETTQGERVSYRRALAWGITGTVGWLIAGAGVLYLQSRYDLDAVNACLNAAEAGIENDVLTCGLADNMSGAEILGPGGWREFMRWASIAVVSSLLLLFVWALSIALPRDKSGFHNRICGTRFVKLPPCHPRESGDPK